MIVLVQCLFERKQTCREKIRKQRTIHTQLYIDFFLVVVAVVVVVVAVFCFVVT